jgi:hypothetical protein
MQKNKYYFSIAHSFRQVYNKIMRSRPRWFWILIIPVLVSVLGVTVSFAQSSQSVRNSQSEQRKYFSETGHWVIGDFLAAYESVARPILLYGLPITDEFVSAAAGGRRVQYFERVRFEYRPENPPELRVVKSPLGQVLYDQDQTGLAISLPQGDAGCRYFSETDFQVCYAFLDFFDAYGGIDQFGYPISDLEQHETFIVQYFQFARLEWHPEQPAGQQVMLTDVGRRYFARFEDPRLAQPITNSALHVVMDLQVQAYVYQPVMTSSGEQTVYVVVQDQSLAPVAGAVVTVSLRRPEAPAGGEINLPVTVTDAKGIARITFPLRNQPNGLVEIVVSASYNDLTRKTITSYRVWW